MQAELQLVVRVSRSCRRGEWSASIFKHLVQSSSSTTPSSSLSGSSSNRTTSESELVELPDEPGHYASNCRPSEDVGHSETGGQSKHWLVPVPAGLHGVYGG